MKLWKILFIVLAVGGFAGTMTFRSAEAQDSQQPFVQQILNAGTSSFQASLAGEEGPQGPELDPALDFLNDETVALSGQVINRSIVQGSGIGPTKASWKKEELNLELDLSFDGLTHRDQRLANNGNQFSVEPPDQGLCVGNGFVVETVNDVLRVFDTSGTALTGVVDLNTFYGYAAAIVRPSTFGPEVTDPSCYFDSDTQRWFIVALTLDRVGKKSTLTGSNHLDVAVSTTSNPLGTFNIYRLPAQDDGTQGTPNHNCAGGPCLGDYPHIGADANGFYITTNEFNFFAAGFRGSQIYALSKRLLGIGASAVPVFQFDTASFLLDGLPGHTVWPASAPASADEDEASGTEFFLSSVAVFSPTRSDNRIRIWALTNTESLNDPITNLRLNSSFINVNTYAVPPKADQKAGDIPLGDCINDTTTTITSLGPPFTGCWKALFGAEPAHTEVESNHVDANDSRIQTLVLANGKLWSALDTAVTVDGATKAGIAFYIIHPKASRKAVSGRIIQQGTLALSGNNLTYPAVGATSSGRGVIAFTLLGAGGTTEPGNFPSAAFAALDAELGVGPIKVAREGLGPDDGFTAYKAEVGNSRNRWGDYGAAVADGDSIWIASEYIGQTCTLAQYVSAPFGSCGATRTLLGNWYTRISKVSPERSDDFEREDKK
jgi:hypothetical protein